MKGAILQVSSIIFMIVATITIFILISQTASEEKNIILRNDYAYSARNDFEIAKNSIIALSKVDSTKIKNLNLFYEGNDENKITITTEKCENNKCNILISVYQPIIQLNLTQRITLNI
ncbi:MAG: hypothetical protein QXF15_01560 [Candidatus Aenigmatarchaeota archaeon]|nr:hypothetical protein [Candidatus Aenigmarchaeota archaeon]